MCFKDFQDVDEVLDQYDAILNDSFGFLLLGE